MSIRIIRVTFAIATACLMAATPASAQFSKLKKAAADKAKEAAGLNKDVPKATQESSPSRDYTITSERVDVMLKALAPMIAQAEREQAAKNVRADYDRKYKAASDCMEAEGKARAAAMMTPDPANMEKYAKLLERNGAMTQRYATAQQNHRYREALYLQDSTQVLGMEASMAMLGITKCGNIPHRPAALIEADAEQMSNKSRSEGTRMLTVEQESRGGLTYQQFGMIRERIGMWSLIQTGNAKAGDSKYSMYTEAEQAALDARGAELKKLAPLFKSGTLGWSTWNDLTQW